MTAAARSSTTALATLLLTLLVLASGCNDSDDDERTGPPGDESAGAFVDRAELRPKLASLDDVGTEPSAPSAPETSIPSGFAARDPNAQTMEAFMTSVLEEVDGFWVNEFRRAGQSYESARYVLVPPGGSAPSNCGPMDASVGAAFCVGPGSVHEEDRIYAEVGWMESEIYNEFGDNAEFAVASVLAHELAHHVQHQAGLIRAGSPHYCCDLVSYNVELHADCLSGIWARSLSGQQRLEPGDFEEAIRAARQAADLVILDPRREGVHGTPAEREAFYRQGYNQGTADACDPALRPVPARAGG